MWIFGFVISRVNCIFVHCIGDDDDDDDDDVAEALATTCV